MKFIKDWEELRKIPQESSTHTLRVGRWSGWIQAKTPSGGSWGDDNHYLSTHTFYEGNHKKTTELLQKCGFNVVLDNWDK